MQLAREDEASESGREMAKRAGYFLKDYNQEIKRALREGRGQQPLCDAINARFRRDFRSTFMPFDQERVAVHLYAAAAEHRDGVARPPPRCPWVVCGELLCRVKANRAAAAI